jgi:fructan beta-fructosidase
MRNQTISLYQELHRPQFHFAPKRDWMNDPNGLVYYKGEFHLFFQYSPGFINHAPNSWGHAVSTDLVHWRQIENGLEPDEYGWIWSGSAVVDRHNTAGFRRGGEEPIVAIYTTGGFGEPGSPCVQYIAYSNDRGRTFTSYAGNPVLGHIRAANRDPKVIWHEPTKQWVMALFLDGNDYALFGSPDLKTWDHLCDLEVKDTGECPDLFELPVDGDRNSIRWVFWGAAGVYRIGTFDGKVFAPETEALRAEHGANGYAAQTWSNLPAEDGRLVQISWMAGGRYPSMPFNQQLSFPVELSLRTTRDGIRLFRNPVPEIERLHTRQHEWKDHVLRSGWNRRALFVRYGPSWRDHMPEAHANLIPNTTWDLFDIRAEIELSDASAWGMIIHGNDLQYDASNKQFTFLGRQVPVEPDDDGRLRLQILVDRASLELFIGRGRISASFCCLPGPCDYPLECYAKAGSVRLVSLVVHELASAWE